MNHMMTIVSAMGVTFILSTVAFPRLILYFRHKQLGQTTLEDGPTWHEEKSGTPTMGGVNIIFFSVVIALIWSYLSHFLTSSLLLVVFAFLFYGMIGFVDDFVKLFMKRNLGLSSKQKMLAQIIGGIIVAVSLANMDISTIITLPVLGDIHFNFLYYPFIIFWIVGFSNATNLTDGIDGLLGSTGTVAYATYGMIATLQEKWELSLFAWIVVGSLLSFLIFNKKPARIFMGDVGSLALGAGLAALSILLKVEWTLLLIGFVFVCETASVMIQVFYFKKTGKRIFKMTPIHHHFEMCHWSENKIVVVFSLITLVGSILTLMIL